MREVSPKKVEMVAALVDAFVNSPVIGVARVEGIPAPQMQQMRAGLRGKVGLVVSKNRFINMALVEASSKKKGLEKLSKVVDGQTAMVLSDINPFRLFKELESTMTSAPAKGGEIAPSDIMVRAGDTPFKPGPIVGDLQKAGIPASIEGGKVVIKKDKVLVRAGDKISKDIANALTRLEIYPLTVGLDLKGAYEDGVFYERSSLAIDDEEYLHNIQEAARQSLNLAVFIAYPSPITIPILLSKASREAFSLAINSGFPTKETMEFMLLKANAEMLSLASAVPDALDDELKERLSVSPPPEKGPEEEEKADDEEGEKKEDKKKEVSEDEAASGLGQLFG
ncbi:MAG: 50S ribosomal protein L10 [Thermoplasmata archaeon]|nr:50S ribosomal protein L10 [Thermoplasmata archaeon]